MKTVFAVIVPRRRCVLNTPTALALTQTHVHLALVHIFERPVRPDDLAAVQSVYAADTNLNAHECTERRIVPEKLASVIRQFHGRCAAHASPVLIGHRQEALEFAPVSQRQQR